MEISGVHAHILICNQHVSSTPATTVVGLTRNLKKFADITAVNITPHRDKLTHTSPSMNLHDNLIRFRLWWMWEPHVGRYIVHIMMRVTCGTQQEAKHDTHHEIRTGFRAVYQCFSFPVLWVQIVPGLQLMVAHDPRALAELSKLPKN